jgi:hypothetical protein
MGEGKRGCHHHKGEMATHSGGPAVEGEGGEVTGAEEGRGRDVQVDKGSGGGGGEVAVGVRLDVSYI